MVRLKFDCERCGREKSTRERYYADGSYVCRTCAPPCLIETEAELQEQCRSISGGSY